MKFRYVHYYCVLSSIYFRINTQESSEYHTLSSLFFCISSLELCECHKHMYSIRRTCWQMCSVYFDKINEREGDTYAWLANMPMSILRSWMPLLHYCHSFKYYAIHAWINLLYSGQYDAVIAAFSVTCSVHFGVCSLSWDKQYSLLIIDNDE